MLRRKPQGKDGSTSAYAHTEEEMKGSKIPLMRLTKQKRGKWKSTFFNNEEETKGSKAERRGEILGFPGFS